MIIFVPDFGKAKHGVVPLSLQDWPFVPTFFRPGPIIFVSMQFSEKNWPDNRLALPQTPPPPWKFWIYHCKGCTWRKIHQMNLQPNYSSFTADNFPVHKAAYKGNLVLLEQLIQGGHRVNQSTYDNVTPLHDACLAGNTNCAWLLIKEGALVTFCTCIGN